MGKAISKKGDITMRIIAMILLLAITTSPINTTPAVPVTTSPTTTKQNPSRAIFVMAPLGFIFY